MHLILAALKCSGYAHSILLNHTLFSCQSNVTATTLKKELWQQGAQKLCHRKASHTLIAIIPCFSPVSLVNCAYSWQTMRHSIATKPTAWHGCTDVNNGALMEKLGLMPRPKCITQHHYSHVPQKLGKWWNGMHYTNALQMEMEWWKKQFNSSQSIRISTQLTLPLSN